MERKAIEVIKEWLENEEYVIVDCDDTSITVRMQMNNVIIYPERSDQEFCTVMLPNFVEVDEDNLVTSALIANLVNSQQKVVKIYITSNFTPLATYEFNFMDEEDLIFQVNHGMNAVLCAKGAFLKARYDLQADSNDGDNE